MTPRAVEVPEKPVPLDEVISSVAPTIRQSLLSSFDDCALSAYFEMRMGRGWGALPQARGTIFHRVAAEILRELRRRDSKTVPVGVALAILEEVLEQRDVEPEDRVRIPLRVIPELRMTVAKFARDNSFSARRILDVEKRLAAPIHYRDDDGQIRERILTGQLDALIADPEEMDAVIVLDWKDTWALPPERPDVPNSDNPALSYHGYFQQRFYGWLVMKVYPTINKVTLREFYPKRTRARAATITRDALPVVEEELSRMVYEFDRTIASGKPRRLRFPDVAPWNPSPGKHCGYCHAPHLCPIPREARERYAITSAEAARQAVAEIRVAEAVIEHRRSGLRPWVETHGPVPVKWSKGRLVFGLYTQKNGRPVLRFFVPEGANRGIQREPVDRKLEDALRRSAAALKEAA